MYKNQVFRAGFSLKGKAVNKREKKLKYKKSENKSGELLN